MKHAQGLKLVNIVLTLIAGVALIYTILRWHVEERQREPLTRPVLPEIQLPPPVDEFK